ncbi:CPBP family glutamic-type intramembrane protease [Clostridium sp. AF02-29]|uniref:CPBP family glutamic-type intramembrane protease n=1 Tax=Clostridium sp. AF02-29 TaxID=2292993 RepID=UPI0030811A0C
MFQNPVMWINIVALPINYFFVFIAFFGEEYGWRYYLQPVLQKRFGLRAGMSALSE